MFPQEDEAWPPSFVAYVTGFTIHWTLLTIVVAWQLWAAGSREASVARKRMRLLAVASTTGSRPLRSCEWPGAARSSIGSSGRSPT